MNLFTGIIAFCAVVMTVSAVRSQRASGRPLLVSQVARPDKPVSGWDSLIATGRRFGATDARVVVLEFVDFECPFCARHLPVLKQALNKHPKDLAVVFRHWPLKNHKFAMPAAMAAECAGDQGKFESYHDVLFATQDSLGLLSFEDVAKRVGVPDLKAFTTCRTSSVAAKARIEADARTVVALGAHGTPTILINGMMYDRPPDAERLEEIISSVLRGKADGK